jgi:hypothetical protein
VKSEEGVVMINRKIIFFFLLCSLLTAHCSLVFAAGKTDAEEQKPINNEWLLCVTQFDYSMLQPSQRISGHVITRNLIDKLKSVSYRLRISPEYAYYEGYAWWQAVNAAAKALSQKQDERSLLLFRGDPDWRYRINVKKLDADIEKLKEELAKKEAERPLVNNEPAFKLIQANLDGSFPEPPKPGGERRFCQNQKADAFLLGAIREFHGRFYITLKLYVLYANAYVYEADIIFSMDDVGGAVAEITGRLDAALSGNRPAVIAVNANPPEAQVLINQNYAGRGAVEAREHPPGKVTVAVAAEGYTPELAETELSGGEITEIEVTLTPLLYSNVHINVPGAFGVSLYQGALYVGEAPYNLRLPIDTLGYVVAETKSGRAAKIVFPTPDMHDESFDFSLKLKKTSTGQKKVNKARGQYYWAWGATWIAAMLAWGANGNYTSRVDVLPLSSSQEFWDDTKTWSYIYNGSLILVGAAGAFTIYELIRYLYISTEDATPIARREKK